MIRNPIHKALLTFQNSSARFLLIGGQACILYGAAEFSRDLDLAIGSAAADLEPIFRALRDLEAQPVFVPQMCREILELGHACHFRCHAQGAQALRIDLISRMRGCPDFETLWKRRIPCVLPEAGEVGIPRLPDLVQMKKTQRDKDWPMIRRLIETDISRYRENPGGEQLLFWFLECRTPLMLADLALAHPQTCRSLTSRRPLLALALSGELAGMEAQLRLEEQAEREKDRAYWLPLKRDLERWRKGVK